IREAPDQIAAGARTVINEIQGNLATAAGGAVFDASNKVMGELKIAIEEQTAKYSVQFAEQIVEVRQKVDAAAQDAGRSNMRIDQVLAGKGIGLREIDRSVGFNEDLVSTLRGFTDALERTVPDDRQPLVKEQLSASRDALDRM